MLGSHSISFDLNTPGVSASICIGLLFECCIMFADCFFMPCFETASCLTRYLFEQHRLLHPDFDPCS